MNDQTKLQCSYSVFSMFGLLSYTHSEGFPLIGDE